MIQGNTRTKIFFSLLCIIALLPLHAQNIAPTDLPDLLLWYRADSLVTTSGSAVSGWGDCGGVSSENLTQVTAAQRPQLVADAGPLLNNKPVIRFTDEALAGNDDLLLGPTVPGINDSSLTIFIVADNLGQTSGFPGFLYVNSNTSGLLVVKNSNGRLTINNTGGQATSGNGVIPDAGHPYRIYGIQKTWGSSLRGYVNGAGVCNSTATAAVGAFTNGALRIGRADFASGNTWNGNIAEVVVYRRALDTLQRQQVQNYLYNKYAPPVSLGPDIVESYSLCPVVLNAGKRFVNYVWSNGSTADTLAVTRSGIYWVRTTDVFGRVSTDTVSVTLPAFGTSQLNDTVLCLGNSVTVTAFPTVGYTYLWSDGSTLGTLTTGIPGNYFVRISDTNGCFAYSDTFNLAIDSFSMQVSLGNDTGLCAGNVIGLASPGTGLQNLVFNWQPGGVTDSVYVVSASGNYSVQVTNSRGCMGYDTVLVSIAGNAPTAAFAPDTVCLGQVFVPVNSSVSNDASPISTYNWGFGDGGISTLVSPQHIYSSAGVYTVTLKVTTAAGCSNVTTQQVLVRDIPQAMFNAPLIGCIQAAIQFTDASIAAPGSAIVAREWIFDAGATSTAQNPQYTYSVANTYNPALVVTDNYGCADTAVASLVIVSSAAAPQVASLVSPTNDISVSSGNVTFIWSSSEQNFALIVSQDSIFGTYNTYNTNDTFFNVNLLNNNSYYWKVRTYSICNDSIDSEQRKVRIFSPSALTDLLLWYRADSLVTTAGAAVSGWGDCGGVSSEDLAQVTVAQRPQLVADAGPLLNNKPAIRFTDEVSAANDDLLLGPTVPGINDSSLTIFVVADNLGQVSSFPGFFYVNNNTSGLLVVKNTNARLTINNNGGQATSANGLIPDTLGHPYRIYGVEKMWNTYLKGYVNGDSVCGSTAPAATGNFNNGALRIGRADFASGNTWNGHIAEVVVYRKALSTVERKDVENYLYNKYAPPVNLGPDIVQNYSLCPVILNASKRFTSYLWSNGSTTDTLSVKQAGTYWVRVTDVFGRVSADTVKVNIPYKGMAFTDTLLCYGNTAIVQPILTASSYIYLWNTGQTTASITTGAPNGYVLAITDTNGCTFITDTTYIMVDSFALVSLLPTDTISCKGNMLAIDSNGYAVTAVQWSTGAISPSVFIDTAGIYTVTATDINQCTVSDVIDITVKGTAPLADFSKTDACFGNANVFTDLSVPAPLDNLSQWQWDFGDGNAASAQNTNHIYDFGGTYPVTLVVGTDSGCTASVTKYVDVFSLPSANFTQLAPVCAGSPANLSDISNAPVGTSIVDWKWVANGTIVSTQQNATVAFAQEGINPLTLIVTTAQGCSDTIVKNVEAFPALLADFEVANVCVGDSSYFFDVTPSYSVISRNWSFGNSATSTLKNPAYKYMQPGNYNVLLTVRNAIGCQDTVLKTVTAAGKPIAKFGSLTGCEDAFYTPLDSSTSAQEPVNSWQWVIGGFEYNTQAPNRYFATPGTYPVKLVVATETGCSDSVTRTVTIQPRPVANFNFTPLYGEAPLDVTFTNLSTGAATYLWQFGDGGNSTLISPVHTYGTNGNYDVSLTAVSQFGCTNTRIKPYTVIPTDLDFSVDEASVIVTPLPDGSSLAQVVVQGSNINTRIINQVGFYVSMGGVGVLAEDWTGTLYTGQVLLDTFSAKFVVPAGKGDSYICVTAMSVNNGQTEKRVDNNEQCITIAEGIQLVGPLPNPALNQSTLGIILPKNGKVTLDIADMTGRYIIQGVELNLPEGRSDYELPIGQMVAGEYFIRILYNDEKVVRKFIISR